MSLPFRGLITVTAVVDKSRENDPFEQMTQAIEEKLSEVKRIYKARRAGGIQYKT